MGLLLSATAAAADSPDGVALAAFAAHQHTPVITGDGSGGAFVAWEDWRASPNTHTFVQHVDRSAARALLEKGYKAEDIRKIYGGNTLRLMRAVEARREREAK